MSEKVKSYDLYRRAPGFDDEPVYIESYETRTEARTALVRRAHGADLMYDDYEIRENVRPDLWNCEECGREIEREEAVTESYPGHRGTVTLAFCPDCS